MSLKRAYLLVAIILIIDQWSKIYIKTNFLLDEEIFGQMKNGIALIHDG